MQVLQPETALDVFAILVVLVERWIGGDVGRSIDNTDDGGYIIAGQVSGSNLWLLKLSEDPYAINEQNVIKIPDIYPTTTIICGSLKLTEGKEYKVYDIMGRVVMPDKIQPGIYFIEIDSVVTQKVIKIR